MRARWRVLTIYQTFEHLIVTILTVLIAVVIVGDYNLPDARDGPLRASLGTFAARMAIGAPWFASYERPGPEARLELDRELSRAARAVRAWPEEDRR